MTEYGGTRERSRGGPKREKRLRTYVKAKCGKWLDAIRALRQTSSPSKQATLFSPSSHCCPPNCSKRLLLCILSPVLTFQPLLPSCATPTCPNRPLLCTCKR